MRTSIVLAGFLLACSSTKATPPGGLPSNVPLSIHGEGVSFAAAGSPAITQAAMVYPSIATDEPPAPLSLTATDGTGLALEALEA